MALSKPASVSGYMRPPMSSNRLPLITYDVLREVCGFCSGERFQLVPNGEPASPGECRHCGKETELADLSDTAIRRLVSGGDRGMVVVRPRA